MVKVRQIKQKVYYGHPHTFWKLRQRNDAENIVDVQEQQRAFDVTQYDSVHLHKAIINRAAEKLTEKLNQEDIKLCQRKEKLKNMLLIEEKELRDEIVIRETIRVCNYCEKKNEEMENFKEEMEKEKIIECRKALQKDKIAKGIHYTKADEFKLRDMQKMQMLEKMHREKEEKALDNMWHGLLLEDVKNKKEKEEYEFEVLKQEMQKRRLTYDEQIASGNKLRREILENERETENKRLKQIKERMDREYTDAIKRKKQQMLENKRNFLQGHEDKMLHLCLEKEREREIDLKRVQTSNDELRREKKNKQEQMRRLQIEKEIFLNNHNMEKDMSKNYIKETELVTSEWKKHQDNEVVAQLKKLKEEKLKNKEKALREYRQHVDKTNMELKKLRQKRIETMEEVKRAAYNELQKNLDSANQELRKQIEYRKSLTDQIYDNRRAKEIERNEIEKIQKPFTKKATTFQDAMADKMNFYNQRGISINYLNKINSEAKKNNQ